MWAMASLSDLHNLTLCLNSEIGKTFAIDSSKLLRKPEFFHLEFSYWCKVIFAIDSVSQYLPEERKESNKKVQIHYKTTQDHQSSSYSLLIYSL